MDSNVLNLLQFLQSLEISWNDDGKMKKNASWSNEKLPIPISEIWWDVRRFIAILRLSFPVISCIVSQLKLLGGWALPHIITRNINQIYIYILTIIHQHCVPSRTSRCARRHPSPGTNSGSPSPAAPRPKGLWEIACWKAGMVTPSWKMSWSRRVCGFGDPKVSSTFQQSGCWCYVTYHWLVIYC